MSRISRHQLFILLLVVAIAGISIWRGSSKTEEPVFCTADAQQCPDGSYVGRMGPTCEFAPCPPAVDAWKLVPYEGQGIRFSYPATLAIEYIAASVWPPEATVAEGEFSCEIGSSSGGGLPIERAQRNINGRTYCIATQSQGAAGTMYIDSSYTVGLAGRLITFRFVLRYPQCANYEESRRQACEAERESFDIDLIIDRMVQSVELW